MISAITSSTLTTICVFLPLVMFSGNLGMVGQIFSGLTFTIVFSLVCSLAVAIILVPVLASKYLKINNVAGRRKEGKLAMVDNAMARFFNAMDKGYAKLVKWVLHHKALFLICILVLLILSFMLIPKIGFVFMPGEASNNVSVQVEMPKGTKLEVTDEVLRQMEAIALQEIKGIQTTTISTGSSGLFGGSGTNSGTLTIKLFPFSERLEGYDSDVTAKEKLRKSTCCYSKRKWTSRKKHKRRRK